MPFTVRLRFKRFSNAAQLAGLLSSYALAKKMEVNRSTVARVVSGEQQPGPTFIAGALTALAPMEFDDLFEIVRDDEVSSGGHLPSRRVYPE
jgi:hypothetical protein